MKRIITIGIGCIVLTWVAKADPVIYTFSGIGTGNLGTTPFSNASFIIMSSADTANITRHVIQGPRSMSEVVFLVSDFQTTVSVSGIGSATFTIPTENVDNNTLGSVGISAPNQGLAILFNVNPTFSNYDLSYSLSWVAGVPAFNPGLGFSTTAGDLILSSVSSVSFQANVIPEPSTFAMLGAASLAAILRRRRCNTPMPPEKLLR